MAYAFHIIFSFVLLTALCAVDAKTNVKQCKDTSKPMPLSVSIEGCEEPPCIVYKGQTSIIAVHFVSTKDNIRNLTAQCYATTLGITVPYELPEDVADVCQNLLYGAMCPLYATEDIVYDFQFYVDTYYPEIAVTIELNLTDADDDVIACFSTSIRVRKGTRTNVITDSITNNTNHIWS
ncbi:mite group 2 allergen Tyr p 2-like isoform X1 [Anastrepha obliqua]|uniref:mite group 2 allergen Tyr p 2-like isoform X1 n=2 Tax=Anastrepha obliqua TaxID=95512 RepID=UPI0024093B37|nr:mite group 2 allergen Tyr p 2-like isoform X1 [Anastrepha obliqua]